MPNDVSATGHYHAYLRQPVKKQPGLDEPVIFKNGGPKAFYVNIEGGCHHGCDCSGWGAFARNRLNTLFTLGTGILLDKFFGGSGGGGGLDALGGWGGNRFGSYNVGSFNIDMSNPGMYTYEAPPKGTTTKKDDPAEKKDDPAVKKDDPAAKKDDPAEKKDDPAVKKDDPVVKKDDPVVKKDNPVADPNGKINELVKAIDGNNAGIITGSNTVDVKNNAGVDNVEAGTAADATKKDKAANGLYQFFTITDASGNKYTLGNPSYDTASDTITYTIVQKESQLNHDDKTVNNKTDKGFEFNKNYNVGTKLTVEVKQGKIVVTNSSGEAIATKDTNKHISVSA